MRIPWFDNRCIVCGAPGALTVEHLIPASLGGDLACEFLCKPCNDSFGSGFESQAKFDPALRLTAARLQKDISPVHRTIEEGQRYHIKAGGEKVSGLWRKGFVVGSVVRLEDGSLMVPDHLVGRKLREMLSAEGHDEPYIHDALAKQASATLGEKVYLSESISITNWPAEILGPDFLAGRQLNALLLSKVAYEFMALLLAEAIYADVPQLGELRNALREQARASPAVVVEYLAGVAEKPFHGIAFEGNDPHARFQIRLFGKWAYRVHFLHVSVQRPPFAYTHDLKTGEHWTGEFQ